MSMKNPVQPGKRRKRRVKPDGKRGNGRNIRSSGRKAAAAIGQPLRRRMVVNDEKMILTMYDIEIAASHGASADSVGPPVKFICLCVARVLFFFPVFLLFFYYYSFFFFRSFFGAISSTLFPLRRNRPFGGPRSVEFTTFVFHFV